MHELSWHALLWSVTFWYGSGSCSFVSDFQDVNKNSLFFAFYFFKVHFHHSSQKKSHKTVHINKGFSSFFYLMMEGSVSDSVQIMRDPDPGGPKTYGSYGSESGSTTLCLRFAERWIGRYSTVFCWFFDRLEPLCHISWCYFWRVCLYLINITLDRIDWTECSQFHVWRMIKKSLSWLSVRN
jgi:hypothetical protein